MKENELINLLAGHRARSDSQLNETFECDSELVRIGDDTWALTMDEFSPDEDLFLHDDPVRLGSNLAVATMIDLLAAGAEPAFFMHGVSLPPDVSSEFVDGLTQGIEARLTEAGCTLVGGDVGTASPWRYCGFAMGPVTAPAPVTPRLPQAPQNLWITGEVGDANLAAFRRSDTPEFELRLDAAELVRSHGTGCIDTSGGLFNALWLLHEQNPELRFNLDLDAVPVSTEASLVAAELSIPVETVLLGGAGEYELLFATPKSLRDAACEAFVKAGGVVIGTAEPGAGVYANGRNGHTVAVEAGPPCARAAGSVEAHVKEVLLTAKELFGERTGS